MTLLVAVKVPSKELNPKRRPLRFNEPGIVMVADTRFTWKSGKVTVRTDDDAQKWWPLGNWICAAYAGDSELAERALLCTRSACAHNGMWDDPDYTLGAVSKLLRYYNDEIGKQRRPFRTRVAMGLRNDKGRFKLYLLDCAEDFRPRERAGLVVIGTGEGYFNKEVVEKEIDHFTFGKAAPVRSGYKIVLRDGQPALAKREPSDLIDVPMIAAAGLIAGMVDRVVREAGLEDVGGQTLLVTLSAQGMYSPHVVISSDQGASWQSITRHDDFRSYTDMSGGEFVGPLLDDKCRFRQGWLTKIGTQPGSITGKVSSKT